MQPSLMDDMPLTPLPVIPYIPKMTVPVIDWSNTPLFNRYRESGIIDFKTQEEEQDYTVFHNLHELEVTVGVI